jgi:hypothetical protein
VDATPHQPFPDRSEGAPSRVTRSHSAIAPWDLASQASGLLRDSASVRMGDELAEEILEIVAEWRRLQSKRSG